MLGSQAAGDGEDTLVVLERKHLVNVGVLVPQSGELGRCKQGDSRIRSGFPQSTQSRSRHHRVTEPVHAANEDLRAHATGLVSVTVIAGLAVAATGFLADAERGFQRLCTQNQLAGSRRMAASKARLISAVMAAMGRGCPSSCVGMALPASMRHCAKPTR